MAAGRTRLLDSSHERRFLAILRHVDEGLARVEALCAGRPSPFARERGRLGREAG